MQAAVSALQTAGLLNELRTNACIDCHCQNWPATGFKNGKNNLPLL